jgi:hypothetical protein
MAANPFMQRRPGTIPPANYMPMFSKVVGGRRSQCPAFSICGGVDVARGSKHRERWMVEGDWCRRFGWVADIPKLMTEAPQSQDFAGTSLLPRESESPTYYRFSKPS